MRIHLTKKSTNRKTGPIPVSTTEEKSCPKSCPWFGQGCYANQGPLRLHWGKVSNGVRGSTFNNFLTQIQELDKGQIWRHNQAGDLPGTGERINSRNLQRLVNASRGKRGFTYTHKTVEGDSFVSKRNRLAIKKNNKPWFTINLSGNNIEHADKLVRLNLAPVTTVVPSTERRKSFKSPDGNQVTVCPATYENKDINCEQCKLCAIHNRKSIIAFPAHGSQVRKMDAKLV